MSLGIIGSAIDWVEDKGDAAVGFVDDTIQSAVDTVDNTVESIEDAVDSVTTSATEGARYVVDTVRDIDPETAAKNAAKVAGLYAGGRVLEGIARETLREGVRRYASPPIQEGVEEIFSGMKKAGRGSLDVLENTAKRAGSEVREAKTKASKALRTGVDVASKASKAAHQNVIKHGSKLIDAMPKGSDPVGNWALEHMQRLSKTAPVQDLGKLGKAVGHFGKAGHEIAKGVGEAGEVVARRGGQVAKAGGKGISGAAKTLGKGAKAGGKLAAVPLVGAAFELHDRDWTGAIAEVGDIGIMATGPLGVGAVAVTMVGSTAYGLGTGKHEFIGVGPAGLTEVLITGD